jgi:hypothetical protein
MSKFATELQNAFTQFPQLTIRQLAIATDTTYQVLLNGARKPIAGVAYDPNEVNWDEISKILERRGLEELPNLEEVAANKRVVLATTKTSDVQVGDHVKLKYEASTTAGEKEPVYEILYLTSTHVVFMDIAGTQPRVMNHGVFTHQGPMKVSKEG